MTKDNPTFLQFRNPLYSYLYKNLLPRRGEFYGRISKRRPFKVVRMKQLDLLGYVNTNLKKEKQRKKQHLTEISFMNYGEKGKENQSEIVYVCVCFCLCVRERGRGAIIKSDSKGRNVKKLESLF